MENPFLIQTTRPLVAIPGSRCGYLQLATRQEIYHYQDLPTGIFIAAQDWASRLEALGAKRVYWITLSEVLPHLHIHLYPRWSDEEAKGLPLFEARTALPQPPWVPSVKQALSQWSEVHQVSLTDS